MTTSFLVDEDKFLRSHLVLFKFGAKSAQSCDRQFGLNKYKNWLWPASRTVGWEKLKISFRKLWIFGARQRESSSSLIDGKMIEWYLSRVRFSIDSGNGFLQSGTHLLLMCIFDVPVHSDEHLTK